MAPGGQKSLVRLNCSGVTDSTQLRQQIQRRSREAVALPLSVCASRSARQVSPPLRKLERPLSAPNSIAGRVAPSWAWNILPASGYSGSVTVIPGHPVSSTCNATVRIALSPRQRGPQGVLAIPPNRLAPLLLTALQRPAVRRNDRSGSSASSSPPAGASSWQERRPTSPPSWPHRGSASRRWTMASGSPASCY